jgi:hypothetical protein
LTGFVAHLQVSVPPPKLELPAFMPLSTAGWIFTPSVLAMVLPSR